MKCVCDLVERVGSRFHLFGALRGRVKLHPPTGIRLSLKTLMNGWAFKKWKLLSSSLAVL